MLKGSVNKKAKGETLLMAVTFEPGSQRLLLDLLNDRSPMAFTVFKRWTIYAQENADLSEVHTAITKYGKAIIGKTTQGNGYVAVPFVKDRLLSALLRSANTLRLLRTGIRLITNESDLLNKAAYTAPTRVYKDD